MNAINWKGLLNWLGSAMLFAGGTAIAGITLVPDMNWKQTLALAATTFGTSLMQHIRSHPFDMNLLTAEPPTVGVTKPQ